MAQGGDGVGHLADGRVVFVPRSLPGDLLEIRLVRQKKTFARGEIVRVLEASKARTESQCGFFRLGCGGCQYWHTSYELELGFKSTAARETIERISGLELPQAQLVASPQAHHYRNRVTFHLRSKGRSGAKLGFFAEGSHDVVTVDNCLVAQPIINEARNLLFALLGGLEEAELVIETASTRSVVAILTSARPIKDVARLRSALSALVERSDLIAGVRVVDASSRWAVGDIEIDAERVLATPPISGHRLPAGHFRQANDAVNALLVGHVRELVGRLGRPRVLELFCGAGNIAFALADVVSSLVGVEGDRHTTRAAQAMAEAAGLSTFEFIVGDLAQGFGGIVEAALEDFDVLVLDPPRQGASAICEEIVARQFSGSIVYVSCDPACLGRDLKILAQGGWQLEALSFFDMFARTSHIETVAALRSR